MYLKIQHRTSYRYDQPVVLGDHRVMVRPRDSRDLRLVSSDLLVTPVFDINWAQDIFGNAVATASFRQMTDQLVIDAVADLELYSVDWPVFNIAVSAMLYPFRYSDDDWTDLGALAVPGHLVTAGRLRDWSEAFVLSSPTDTLSLSKTCATESLLRLGIRAARRKEHSLQSRRLIEAGVLVGTSPFYSLRRCAVLDLARGSYRATSIYRIKPYSDRPTQGRCMPGRKSTFQAPAG